MAGPGYFTSGVFLLNNYNDGIASGATINVCILNTGATSNNAEIRIFQLTDVTRTLMTVIPSGQVAIEAGKVKTFSTTVPGVGAYEVEVYLENPDAAKVMSQAFKSRKHEPIKDTRISNSDFTQIDNFLD